MHQGDVSVIMPTFYGDEHLGWSFANMHVLDVGGVGISGYAPGRPRRVAGGHALPAGADHRERRDRREWETLHRRERARPGRGAQRHPLDDRREQHRDRASSTRSSTSSGVERHREYCEINKDLTEQVHPRADLQDARRRLRGGRLEHWDGHDGPDQLLELRLRLEVEGSDLRFFYTGAPQIDAFVNSTFGPDVRARR